MGLVVLIFLICGALSICHDFNEKLTTSREARENERKKQEKEREKQEQEQERETLKKEIELRMDTFEIKHNLKKCENLKKLHYFYHVNYSPTFFIDLVNENIIYTENFNEKREFKIKDLREITLEVINYSKDNLNISSSLLNYVKVCNIDTKISSLYQLKLIFKDLLSEDLDLFFTGENAQMLAAGMKNDLLKVLEYFNSKENSENND